MMRAPLVLALMSAFAAPALAKGWPALPKEGEYVYGRAATPEDIKAKRAVCKWDDIYFDIGDGGPLPGRPLEGVVVPQYAWFVDPPFSEDAVYEPVVIIQAEAWGEDGAGAGVRRADGSLACIDFIQIELLGTDPAKLPKLK